MKTQELINLTDEELRAKIKALKEEIFKLNLQRYTGNVDKPHLFKAAKKDIARIETILNARKEKKNG